MVAQTTQATSSPSANLALLSKKSLKRYVKHHNLKVKGSSKTDLLFAVQMHFDATVVQESEVIQSFLAFVRMSQQADSGEPATVMPAPTLTASETFSDEPSHGATAPSISEANVYDETGPSLTDLDGDSSY
jgi:Sin3 binding region of histone deacetylase complex subunit SAP30